MKLKIKPLLVCFGLLLFGLQIKLAPGLYIFEIFLISILLAKIFKKPNCLLTNECILPSMSFFVLLSIYLVNSIKSGALNQAMIVPYKMVIFFLYSLSFRHFLKITGGGFFLEALLSLPLVISIAMYFKILPSSIASLYDDALAIDPLRYGGIFGPDVVSLGAYGGILATFCLLRWSATSNGLPILIFNSALMVFVAIISGSRTGIILYGMVSLLIFGRLFFISAEFTSRLKVFFLIALMVAALNWVAPFLPDRFAIEILLSHAFGSDDGVHVGSMYQKLMPQFWLSATPSSLLIGVDYEWDKPDSLYLFMLAQFGLLGSVVFVGTVAYLIFLTNIGNLYRLVLLVMFLALAYKGLFFIANYFIFMSIFFYYLIKSELCQNFRF